MMSVATVLTGVMRVYLGSDDDGECGGSGDEYALIVVRVAGVTMSAEEVLMSVVTRVRVR